MERIYEILNENFKDFLFIISRSTILIRNVDEINFIYLIHA